MKCKDVEINGQKIAFCESDGTGQPILFVHGNSMSARCFTQQFESPLGERFRCIALDLPGHGASAPAVSPETTCTLPGYAALVADFARQLAIEEALLVGWSLGGHVLLEAGPLLPSAKGMLIFGTPPVGNPIAADAFLPNPIIQLLFKNHVNKEEASAVVSAFFRQGNDIPLLFTEDLLRTDGKAREALAQSLAAGLYSDEVEIAARLTVPLAILHGDQDALVSLSYLQKLTLPTLWQGKIHLITDAGHAPQWEQPEQFNRLLERFAEGV